MDNKEEKVGKEEGCCESSGGGCGCGSGGCGDGGCGGGSCGGCGGHKSCCAGKAALVLVLLLVGGLIGFSMGRCSAHRMSCAYVSCPMGSPMAPQSK